MGIVGDGEIRDSTTIGDVVITAARLQAVAAGGAIVMSETVARITVAGCPFRVAFGGSMFSLIPLRAA